MYIEIILANGRVYSLSADSLSKALDIVEQVDTQLTNEPYFGHSCVTDNLCTN